MLVFRAVVSPTGTSKRDHRKINAAMEPCLKRSRVDGRRTILRHRVRHQRSHAHDHGIALVHTQVNRLQATAAGSMGNHPPGMHHGFRSVGIELSR